MLHHEPDIALENHIRSVLNDVRSLAGNRDVSMVAVSKYTDTKKMETAYRAGIRHFGESRVMDGLDKKDHFPSEHYPDLSWHFIGTIQTNKLAKSMGHFALFHSLSSTRHADAMSSMAQEQASLQNVLLQVNISQDATRQGFQPEDLKQDFEKLLGLRGIQIQGLMAMAPPETSLAGNRDELNHAFESVRLLRDELSDRFAVPLPELSMGMSRDYPEAIAQGATIVRIGTALFTPPL